MIYNFVTKTVINKFNAHENRVKDIALVNLNHIDSSLIDKVINDNIKWLVSISSDGFIKIWSLDTLNVSK